ncbi:MAG: glycosyltransferase [Bacteroidales bacterium]|nr:glycosyltransferase [Bacteroidales bacterium]HOY38837.1 glycosyltransferase [Bacteroidales bacterium]HQP04898.1 glycosyltransferase [Bacteroidales bacterium]
MIAAAIIYGLFIALLFLYLMYPLWLLIYSHKHNQTESFDVTAYEVSVVLFSYNGGDFLKTKILFLLKEISKFRNAELIVIDDFSQDGSIESICSIENENNLRIIRKCEHKGIPDSMNTAVQYASYSSIVFCDQRQQLECGAIALLVNKLEHDDCCAASSCISHISKDNCFSWIRRYENIIKNLESCSGSLIGVYGPLYAFKKSAFSPVPAGIILDDLYLSLKILSKGKIIFVKDCIIYDENVDRLFNYKRTKRYVNGFAQIIADRQLMTELSPKHKLMLFWHKYLRLVIPVLFIAVLILTVIYAFHSYIAFLLFSALMLGVIYSLTPDLPQFFLTNSFRINTYYFIAILELMVRRIGSVLR